MASDRVVLQKSEVVWWQTVVRDALKSHSDITVAARTADRLVMELRGRLTENQVVPTPSQRPDCTCRKPYSAFHEERCPVTEWAIDQKAIADRIAESTSIAFMECDTCRRKPGSPPLCQGCLHNRNAIDYLMRIAKIAEDLSLTRAANSD